MCNKRFGLYDKVSRQKSASTPMDYWAAGTKSRWENDKGKYLDRGRVRAERERRKLKLTIRINLRNTQAARNPSQLTSEQGSNKGAAPTTY